MKRLLTTILKTIFYFVLCAVLAVFETIKYIFTGSNFVGRIMILGGYTGLATLAIMKPTIFMIILVLLAVCNLLESVYMVRHIDAYEAGDSRQERQFNSFASQKNLFFEGMSVEDAKKEYRKLMKQYHPDNANGDAEMSKKISAAYTQFCSVYGR